MIIKLDEYKENAIYFNLLDILIRKVAPNRDLYLEDLDIAPTTYKRCKHNQSKKSTEILTFLANKLNYKIPSKELIDEVETKINKIYHDVYYKIESNYEDDINYLDKMLEDNNLIFPVLKIMKLLLFYNLPLEIEVTVVKFNDLFEEVKGYLPFFNKDLLNFYELFNILRLDDIDVRLLAKDFENELCYTALVSKLFKQGRYIECLYLSSKIKKQYIIDENYKRILSLNLYMMDCYNYLEEYQSAYDLSRKQMMTLYAMKLLAFHYEAAEFHHLVACFGLNKFEEIIEILDKKEQFKIKHILLMLVSKYKIGINEYTEYFNLLLNNAGVKTKVFLQLLNEILFNNQVMLIDELKDPKYNISTAIINILKKMFDYKN